jgi:hypothetical protein
VISNYESRRFPFGAGRSTYSTPNRKPSWHPMTIIISWPTAGKVPDELPAVNALHRASLRGRIARLGYPPTSVRFAISSSIRMSQQLAPTQCGIENPIAADRMARNALNVIRIANAQIPRMKLPRELVRSGRYNVFSDQFRGPR